MYREFGYEVISVDNDRSFTPTHLVNILEWKYWEEFEPEEFDTIVCCPPCTEFSRAKTTAPRDFATADALVEKALEIIQYFKPQK